MGADMSTRETFAQAVREWRQSGKPFSAEALLARWNELERAK
jgi:hypothetical protein